MVTVHGQNTIDSSQRVRNKILPSITAQRVSIVASVVLVAVIALGVLYAADWSSAYYSIPKYQAAGGVFVAYGIFGSIQYTRYRHLADLARGNPIVFNQPDHVKAEIDHSPWYGAFAWPLIPLINRLFRGSTTPDSYSRESLPRAVEATPEHVGSLEVDGYRSDEEFSEMASQPQEDEQGSECSQVEPRYDSVYDCESDDESIGIDQSQEDEQTDNSDESYSEPLDSRKILDLVTWTTNY